jgi:hypothetical protein
LPKRREHTRPNDCRKQYADATGDYARDNPDKRGNKTRFEGAKLAGSSDKQHVERRHTAPQGIRRYTLHERGADIHTHHVGGTDDEWRG